MLLSELRAVSKIKNVEEVCCVVVLCNKKLAKFKMVSCFFPNANIPKTAGGYDAFHFCFLAKARSL